MHSVRLCSRNRGRRLITWSVDLLQTEYQTRCSPNRTRSHFHSAHIFISSHLGGDITCGCYSFEKSCWGMYSVHGSRRRSRHFCSKCKRKVGLEPPPYSCDTGHCMMDLEWKRREIGYENVIKMGELKQMSFFLSI